MNEKEKSDLNFWIAENVMQEMVSFGCILRWRQLPSGEPEEIQDGPIPNYTTDPTAAMEVESRIAEKFGSIRITKCKDGWMSSCRNENGVGETRMIASCNLSKIIFSK